MITETKMIIIIHIARVLLAVVAMLAIVSAADVRIWPNIPELTLTSGDDLKLNCTADVPVQWNQNKFDRSLTENNSSIDIISQGTVNDSYVSVLSLSRASYLDTGYYYCDDFSKDLQEQNSAKIYIYVQHDKYLLAIPENVTELKPNEYDNIILPCRPTSPDITVTLTKDGEDITENLEYDPKIGYLISLPTVQDTGVFICRATRNDMSQSREFNVLVTIKHTKVDKIVRPYISSNIGLTDTLIIGQNVSLNCSVSMELGSLFTLYWIVPNEQKQQVGHVLIGKENVFNGLKHGVGRSFSSRLLTIQNVTTEDEGDYVCEVKVQSGQTDRTTYKLLAFTTNMTYLSLSVQGNVSEITCMAGSPSVQWIIQVSAFPKASLLWKDPNGEELGRNPEKVSVENDTSTSKLVIKHLQLNDSGIYELVANNDAHEEKIAVTLLVKDKPLVQISNSSDSNIFYEVGKMYSIECDIRGYPLPHVEWAFKKCLDYQRCQESFTQIPRNMYKETEREKTFLKSLINITLNETGILFCNATNEFGNSNSTFLMSDKPIEHEDFGFIVFCSVITILLVVLMIVCAVYLKRAKNLKESTLASMLHFENGSWTPDLGIAEQAELLPYDKRWEFPRDKLILGKQLGLGTFGVVFKADAIGIIHKDITTTVAVKIIKPNTDPSYIKDLASELKNMIHLGRHFNVVNLLGTCTGNIYKRELIVIVEYCRFGNIHQYMLKQRNCFVNQVTTDGYLDYNITTISKNPYYESVPNKSNLSKKCDDSSTQIGTDGYLVPDEVEPEWRSNNSGDLKNLIVKPLCTNDLICWSFQVARGMDYLASRKILHGDLAARNILLSEENIVKICDFGFAKTMWNSKNYKIKSDKDILLVKWMAIESLCDRVFSTQSDVWAFGIVLWEIFSLAVTPYPNIQKFNDLFKKLVEGYRMEQPKYANSEIYNIMLDCWKMNPMKRPSFTDLAERLGDLLQDGTKSYYMNLNEVYMRMNTEGSTSTDYLSLLTEPTYLNCSTVSKNNLNLALNSPENSENKDDLKLRPMLHNPALINATSNP